jgi:hypothetical protein
MDDGGRRALTSQWCGWPPPLRRRGWAPGGAAVGAGDGRREESRMPAAPYPPLDLRTTPLPAMMSLARRRSAVEGGCGCRPRLTAPLLRPLDLRCHRPRRPLLVLDPPRRELGGATPGGVPTGRWRPGAREERRGEDERAEGRGGREKGGTLMLTNFNTD